MNDPVKLINIVAGGQTGVDRAALRAAEVCSLTTGGWCPPQRQAEDGALPPRYGLLETPQDRSALTSDVPRSQRTEWNVRDSEATLILSRGRITDAGTRATRRFCTHYNKPVLLQDLSDPRAAEKVAAWMTRHDISVLNVAGPSESAQSAWATQPTLYCSR